MTRRILLTVVLLGGMFGLQANTFVSGVENSPTADSVEGIGDFNDMIVQFSAAGLQLTSTSPGTWQSPFNSSVVNESGPSTTNPFWDNPSRDGSDKNVGFCLTTTNCSLSATPAAVTQYLTDTGNQGLPDSDFYFTFSGSVNTVFLQAITPQSNQESFGIYNTSNAGQVQWIIQNGVNIVGTSFTPNYASFGLVFELAGSSGDVYYSQNSIGAYVNYAASSVPENRFAMFQLPDASVPEPGTMVLFGIGALALGILPRLRKRR